jgi:hypothetical protein
MPNKAKSADAVILAADLRRKVSNVIGCPYPPQQSSAGHPALAAGSKHEKTTPMRKIEILVIGLIYGAIPVIAGFLAGWWVSIPFVPESRVFICALAGIAAGILIDAIFLKKWIRRAYSASPAIWVGIYLFYSVGILGFFMGVPLFNVALAVPAGIFIGGRLAHKNVPFPEMKKAARRATAATSFILALVCGASATLALIDPYTAGDLQGMLALSFSVTTPMILGIILIGGSLLVSLHWWLMKKTVELTYSHFYPAGSSVSI